LLGFQTYNYNKTNRDKLEQELIKFKESSVYKTITKIFDWNDYFSIKKILLEEELKKLKLI